MLNRFVEGAECRRGRVRPGGLALDNGLQAGHLPIPNGDFLGAAGLPLRGQPPDADEADEGQQADGPVLRQYLGDRIHLVAFQVLRKQGRPLGDRP